MQAAMEEAARVQAALDAERGTLVDLETPAQPTPSLEVLTTEGPHAAASTLAAVLLPRAHVATAVSNFDPAHKIGSGGFGPVFKGVGPPNALERVAHLHSGPVAIKVLERVGGQGERELLTEVDVLNSCRHPNLLRLLGFCNDTDFACLVYPLALGGNLEDRLIPTRAGDQRLALLRLHHPKPLHWRERASILRDVLGALLFLHTPTASKPRVIHRDVKTSNILLDAHGTALLADVGLAKATERLARESSATITSAQTHLSTQRILGTPGFVDPLAINAGQHSELTDGYSMGITALMMLTGLPALGLREACRHIVRSPDRPDKWRAPAMADERAGAWPEHVAITIAEIAVGLTEEFKSDRLPLAEALDKLGAALAGTEAEEVEAAAPQLHDAASVPSPTLPAQPSTPPPAHSPEPDEVRNCIICEESPKELRFACGHAVYCRTCFESRIKPRAAQKARDANNSSLSDEERKRAALEAVVRCPHCQVAVGEAMLERADDAATAPTFVMPSAQREGESSPGALSPPGSAHGPRGGGKGAMAPGRRGGRGGRGSGIQYNQGRGVGSAGR